jgi:ABC-type branched-subunit amino acid transport system ATPase component/branched-subunit amino acid ABC-type transport system permease component
VPYLQYAILGLGAGAAYALAGLGVVVVYRGSGVLNFAAGAIGMFGAYIFYKLWTAGVPWPFALVVALAIGAAIGATVHLLIMRPLRNAPPITHLIATLGLFSLLTGLGEMLWGYYKPTIVDRLVPTGNIRFGSQISVNRDRLIIFGIGILLTALLWAVFRYTKFGLATSSVAESRRASATVGLSADVIAALNWALGSALAILATVLTTSIVSVLQVESITLIVIPAFAAALIGSFRSFWLTLAGGLMIGILNSEGAYLQLRFPTWPLDGWADSVPFIVIIIVVVVRGRGLPLRSQAILKPPRIGIGEVRPVALAVGFVAVGLGAWYLLSAAAIQGFIQSCAVALIVLSVVVITGYAGQLSLAQYAVAGAAGWTAAQLVAKHGWSSELAWVVVLVGIVPFGIVIGLPALRTRGVNLAVVTLGLASILGAQLFSNTTRTGGVTGLDIGSLHILGLDIGAVDHPQRYAIFAMILVTLAGLAVANLRRSGIGRQLLAVRSNERAAASLGISVGRAKLFAFSVASVLAALGGLVITFTTPTPSFTPQFNQFQSIQVVVLAVIGGIGFIMGSVLGGIIAPAALLTGILAGPTSNTFLDPLFNNPQLAQVLLGLVVFDVLRRNPDGIVAAGPPPALKWVAKKLRLGGLVKPKTARARTDPVAAALVAHVAAPPVRVRFTGKSLACTGIGVRFGGVRALKGVSLEVHSGEVLGVIGANGAGKTTLLDALTGFVDIDGGEIEFNGEPINDWSVAHRARAGIRRSFQGLELFETMTVRENLAVAFDEISTGRSMRDIVVPHQEAWTPAALASISDFHLDPVINMKPEDLSYGQRRLVAIARAAASAPQILLLDEPAAGLDSDERDELAALIQTFATEWGVGVLLIEHDVEFVMGCSDRMVALDFGEVISSGTPAEVRADERVVAAYLGTSTKEAREVVAVVDELPAAVLGGAMSDRDVADVAVHHADELAETRAGSLLTVTGLDAGYGGVPVVHGLDLWVDPGEVLVLLGPNGAGKSTTLLTIAGELPALGGSMDRLGMAKSKLPLHQLVGHGLGFVMEERCITSSLTTQENLKLGRGSVDAAVEFFPELGKLMNRPAGLLSGGEQRMLALGRVLAAKPKLLLADELSLGLAPQLVERLLTALRDATKTGVGVLLVEQHAEQALEVADRFLVLRRGEVVSRGQARDVRGDFAALAESYLS